MFNHLAIFFKDPSYIRQYAMCWKHSWAWDSPGFSLCGGHWDNSNKVWWELPPVSHQWYWFCLLNTSWIWSHIRDCNCFLTSLLVPISHASSLASFFFPSALLVSNSHYCYKDSSKTKCLLMKLPCLWFLVPIVIQHTWGVYNMFLSELGPMTAVIDDMKEVYPSSPALVENHSVVQVPS